MADKPKVAICWLGGCGGCDEAVVDLNEAILDVTNAADIIFWPVAMDFKYHHIKSMANNEIELGIINGNIRNAEQEEVANLIRKKSRHVLSFGACACFGGTPGMANFRTKDDIFNWVYRDAPTVVNPNGNYPQVSTKIGAKELTLPEFYEQVYALNQKIDVDYYLPGCPPPPDLIANAVFAVLEGKLPPKGATLAPPKALCDSCSRNKTKPSRIAMKDIKRIHEIEASQDTCFLAQEILCMGPATRDGCGEACIKVNLPCRGCFGPVKGVKDFGTKFIASLVAMFNVESDREMRELIDKLDDPSGYLYRFSLPISTLIRKRV